MWYFGSINKNALRDTYKGLSRLEYRGYDSFGYAAALKGDKVDIVKGLGSVDKVAFDRCDKEYRATIGHVRWADQWGSHSRKCPPSKL